MLSINVLSGFGGAAEFRLEITSSSNAGTNLFTVATSAGYVNGPITIIIASGVTLGAPNTSTAGVTRGSFPSGVVPHLINNGNIYGYVHVPFHRGRIVLDDQRNLEVMFPEHGVESTGGYGYDRRLAIEDARLLGAEMFFTIDAGTDA